MKFIKPTYKILNRDIREILFVYDFHKYGDEFIHRFPVYKYENKTLVWCSFIIYEDDMNTMHINVYDSNNNSCNYNKEEYGKSLVTEKINKRIQKELNWFAKERFLIWK